jgi:hypothetical protein
MEKLLQELTLDGMLATLASRVEGIRTEVTKRDRNYDACLI